MSSSLCCHVTTRQEGWRYPLPFRFGSCALAYGGSQKIIIIQLAAHSWHLTQTLDLYVFGIFKVLYKKENKIKGLPDPMMEKYPIFDPQRHESKVLVNILI
jgi:hypothetical protein